MDFAYRRRLLWLGLFAFAIRIAYFLEHLRSPFFALPQLDALYFDTVARAFAAGDWTDPQGGFRALLYPLLVSLVYRLDAQGGVYLVLLLQHVLGLASVLLVADTARRMATERAGLFAGALYALAGPVLFFEGELLSDSALTAAIAFVLWLQARAAAAGRSIAWLWVGVTMAVVAQIRPNIALVAFATSGLACVRWLVHRDSSRLAPCALLAGFIPVLLALGLLFSPLNGRFAPLPSQGGINFHLGNNSRADGMIPRQQAYYSTSGGYQDSVAVFARERYRELALSRGMKLDATPSDISRFWFDETLREVREDPAHFARLMLRKSIVLFWNREIPNYRDYEFTTKHESWLLALMPVRFAVLLALAAAGAMAALTGPRRRPAAWHLLFVASYGASIVLFFVCDRFRLPLWPGLAALAGIGAEALLQPRWHRRAVAVAGAAFAFSAFNWSGVPAFDFSRDYFYRSLANLQRGNHAAAVEDAKASLALEPSNADAGLQLGNALAAAGRDEEARQAYEALLASQPRNAQAMNNLGAIEERGGRFGAALRRYLEASEADPLYAAPLAHAALLEFRGGRLADAGRHATAAAKLDPARADTLALQAVLAATRGDDKAALDFIGRAFAISRSVAEQVSAEAKQPVSLAD